MSFVGKNIEAGTKMTTFACKRAPAQEHREPFDLSRKELEYLDYLDDAISGINEFLREHDKPIGGCQRAMLEASTKALADHLDEMLEDIRQRASQRENSEESLEESLGGDGDDKAFNS